MRHVGTTGRSFVAALVVLTATGSAAVAAARSDGALPPVTQQVVAPLVEAPECWAPQAGTPSTLPGANIETITLTIDATSLLAVDGSGRVTAAETNTGCAPRPTDRLFLVHPDGTITDAGAAALTGVRFTGDFTIFGYHPVEG